MTAISTSMFVRPFREAAQRSPTVRVARWLTSRLQLILPAPAAHETAMRSLIEGYDEMAYRYDALGRPQEAEMTRACADALRQAAARSA